MVCGAIPPGGVVNPTAVAITLAVANPAAAQGGVPANLAATAAVGSAVASARVGSQGQAATVVGRASLAAAVKTAALADKTRAVA